MKNFRWKNLLVIFSVIFFISSAAFAFESVDVLDWTPYAYENITVTTGAVKRPTEAYRNAAGALFLTVETNTIHYRVDSGDPTADLGHKVVAANYQNLWLNDTAAVKNLRMIAVGGNALVKITYYRKR